MSFNSGSFRLADVICFTVLIFFTLSCKKTEDSSDVQSAERVIKVRDAASDFLLPAKLWDMLLSDQAAKTVAPGAAGAADHDDMMVTSVLFAPITVVLEEKSHGVLTYPKLRLEFPKGGGVVDLARYVTGKPGSYYVKFETDGFVSAAGMRVFFLSKARKRKVEHMIVGSGCRSYHDVTTFVMGQQFGKGFLVNTTRRMDASTLGGHFIFSWQQESDQLVNQIMFTDSESPQLFCSSQETQS